MRILRRLLLVLVLLVAVALGGGWLWLRSGSGRAIVKARLEQVLAGASGGTVHVAAVDLPRLGLLVLHDLSISLGGRSLLRSERVEIAYRLPWPAPLTIRLGRVTAFDLDAHLVLRDGHLGPPRPERETGARGASPRLRIGRLEVRGGRIGIALGDAPAARRFALGALEVDAALALGAGSTRLDVGRLVAVPRGLPLEPVRASGHLFHGRDGTLLVDRLEAYAGESHLEARGAVTPEDGITLYARADPLAPRVLRPLAPSLSPRGPLGIEVALAGPARDLRGTATVTLPEGGRVTLEAHADAADAPLSYRLEGHAFDLHPAALRPGLPDDPVQLALHARGRGRRHRVALRATSAAAALAAQAALHLDDVASYRADARADVRDLGRLRPGAHGRFPVHATLEGRGSPMGSGHATLHAEIGHGTLAGRAIEGGVIDATAARARLAPFEARLAGDGATVAVRGQADLGAPSVRLDVDAGIEGRGSLAATIAARRERARWLGSIEQLDVRPDGLATWSSRAPARFEVGERASLEPLRLDAGGQSLSVTGAFGPRRAIDAELEWSRVDLAALCRLAGRLPCEGRSSGRLDVGGTTAEPRLALGAAIDDLSAGPLHGGSVTARATQAAGRASGRVELSALGGSIVVEGSLPLALGARPTESPGALDLKLTARNLRLRRLVEELPALVRSAQGRASADLHLGGTWAMPQPSGVLEVHASRLELASAGAPWRDVDVVLRASGGSRVSVERLGLRGGKGTVRGTGSLDFASGVVPVADLQLTFDHFLAVQRPLLDAVADGSIKVTGPLAALSVRGRMYVPTATIRPAFLPASRGPTRPDPTIEVVGASEPAQPQAPPVGLGQLTLGVTITLGDGVRIRRQDADIQLGGSIRVERTPPEPLSIRGVVEIERGWYTFSSRRFTLRPGSIRFDGGPPSQAKLDIVAARRAGEYDVTVQVTGTVADPTLLLESDPPLSDADVLSVLIFGRPAGELSDDERLAVQAEAVSLAAGYAFGGAGGGGLAQSLGLESLEVSPERLSVSRRVFGDVFLSLSQEFTGWAGQTVGMSYDVTRRLSVQLSTSTRGSGAIDVFWRRRY